MTTGVPNRLMTQRRGAVKGRQARRGDRRREEGARDQPAQRDGDVWPGANSTPQPATPKLALEQLALAIARQPKQWKFEAANDPAFEKLRALPEFQRLIKQ